MNVGQLGRVSNFVVDALTQSNTLETLTAFNNAFNNLINQNNEANQNDFSTKRHDLEHALNHDVFKQIPNIFRVSLIELGIHDLLGVNFLKSINDVLERNQITPVIARDNIRSMTETLSSYKVSLEGVISALKVLKLEESTLEPEEGELSVSMPRVAYDGKLRDFSIELKNIHELVNMLSEIFDGKPHEARIRELSTSDPWVLVTMLGCGLLTFLSIVEKIQNIRLNTKKLRDLDTDAQAADASQAVRDAIGAELENKTEASLNKLVTEILDESKIVNKDRAKELKDRLGSKIRWLAKRLDSGYQVDGNLGLIPEGTLYSDSKHKIASEIRDVSYRLNFMKTPEREVLKITYMEKNDAASSVEKPTSINESPSKQIRPSRSRRKKTKD